MESFTGSFLCSFDGFYFFKKESTNDLGLDASCTEHSSIGPGDSFLSFGEFFVGVWPVLLDAVYSLSTVTAIMGSSGSFSFLLDIMHDKSRTYTLMDAVPGVFTLRTLFEFVL